MGHTWFAVLLPLILPAAHAFSIGGSANVYQALRTASSSANACVRTSAFARTSGLGLRGLQTPALRRTRVFALSMQDLVVEDGDVVGVRYKGTLEDGSVFDENPGMACKDRRGYTQNLRSISYKSD
eukprot:2736234-Rhodomonas_salina.1